MSVTRHHADWLSLIEVSGPFVSLPVLMRTFPQGLEPRDPAQAKALRAAYEEWQDNPSAPGKHRAWVMQVLTAVLGYPANQIAEGQTLPAGLQATMAEMGETLRPDFALVGPAGAETAGQAQLLIASYPAEQSLDKPVIGKHWKATPATRMMELLHGANVPLGLVTNGEHWMLVYAPRGETTGYVSWFGTLWLDEPITLRAFHSLLGVRRFFGVAADSTLLALLKESATDQQEVTEQLGYQVREAVEVLVQSFDAIDKESSREYLKGIPPATVYDAVLTVMMRLVFLFSAEERGLLHLGKPLYDDNYAVSTLQEQLQEVADRYGEEVLERRYDAWTRLLATFRAVHGGIRHQDLLMQAYGGSLFDPDRYPFLEGRAVGSQWRTTPAAPPAVNNRVVLHLLNSLQRLRTKLGAGGTAETRRVSFRALGVEQIGHVYEGLLDHTAFCAGEVMLGIRGTRKKEPKVALSTLEDLLPQGEDKLIEYLKEETDRSLSALRKDFANGSQIDEHRLRVACGHDDALTARLRPFAGLIRDDSFERPLVVPPGSFFVTVGTTRRSTGTHYTPPSLTEPIVQHTLEPLVYVGPAEGLPKEQWKLNSPKEILDLKVCDMAMGSGAFLVQACRFLAERLVEAWENEEKAHPGRVLITPDGNFSEGSACERLVPAEAGERVAIARRVIADRCLYGVDVNPMAVEMAKLSMWLITVDTNRPFTFLDHAFKCGDSLLGVTSIRQVKSFSLRGSTTIQLAFAMADIEGSITKAVHKREALEAMPSDTPAQVANKVTLFGEAEEALSQASSIANLVLFLELNGLTGRAYEQAQADIVAKTRDLIKKGGDSLRKYADNCLGGKLCLHWALVFPEVIARGGFDALIGNPPFIGGQKITGALGTDYRNHLVANIAQGRKGSADLCAYFFLRAAELLRPNGMAGLLATNTISQGETREVGLDALASVGITIPRAVPSTPWPGLAALEVAHIWLRKGNWKGGFVLNEQPAAGITPLLTEPGRISGKPYKLWANVDKSFQGSIVLGMGFVLSPEEAKILKDKNEKNGDCLFPYLNGDDINSRLDQSPSRWVINFFDWPLGRAAEGHWASANDKQRKEWLRRGMVPADYPEPVAADYPDLLAILEERAKPEREAYEPKNAWNISVRTYWWRFGAWRKNLDSVISTQERYLVHPFTGKHNNFAFLQGAVVASHMTVVFATQEWSMYATLQSDIHWQWALEFGNKLETRPQYNNTDCFETFPLPASLANLDGIGERYYRSRETLMQARSVGLTKAYNRFHDREELAPEYAELRSLQVEMDHAVANAYGWHDLNLGHEFRATKQGIRFTMSEVARREVLDRLLALNHQRHAEEVAAAEADPAVLVSKRSRKTRGTSGQPILVF